MKDFEKYSKENIQFYSAHAPDLLIDLISKLNPRSLADLGCGDGTILFDLQRKGLLRDMNNIIAVDLSKKRLERVKNHITNVETICSDVANVKQLKDSQLDLVICTQVIEHVKDDKKLLNKIYRVLRPGGYLYISSVVKKWYGWYFYRCNDKWVLDPTHLREYASPKEFYDLLIDGRFKILDQKLSLFKLSVGNAFNRIILKFGIINENKLRKSKISNIFSNLRIPVFGYYVIEVIARK